MARQSRLAMLALILLFRPGATHAQSPTPPSASEPAASIQSPSAMDSSASFSGLFRLVGADLARLPSRETVLWLGAGAGLSLLGHRADRQVTATLSGSQPVEEALDPGQVIGGVPFQLGATVATYALGRITRKPSLTHLGTDLARAHVVSQAITQGIKVAAARRRPDGTSLSFPSGHSAAAFASAAVLQTHFGWKAGVPAYGVAAYVAASRLSENRHYLSDVIFGATVGIMSARAVTIGHGRARFALVPVATASGAGIALTRVSVR